MKILVWSLGWWLGAGSVTIARTPASGPNAETRGPDAAKQVGEPGRPTFHVDSVATQWIGQTQVPAAIIEAQFQGNTMRMVCLPMGVRRSAIPQPDSNPMSRTQ